MRLIDAEVLIAELHNVTLEDGEDRRIFYESIERQPTIDALEAYEKRIADLLLDNKMLKNTIIAEKFVMLDRIHFLEAQLLKDGEWINDTRYSGWTCTHCNYHDGNKTDNYCPNCGARMKHNANAD